MWKGECLAELMSSISTNSIIIEVQVGNTGVREENLKKGGEEARQLAIHSHRTQLRNLYFGCNSIGAEGIHILFQTFSSSVSIATLYLFGSNIGD